MQTEDHPQTALLCRFFGGRPPEFMSAVSGVQEKPVKRAQTGPERGVKGAKNPFEGGGVSLTGAIQRAQKTIKRYSYTNLSYIRPAPLPGVQDDGYLYTGYEKMCQAVPQKNAKKREKKGNFFRNHKNCGYTGRRGYLLPADSPDYPDYARSIGEIRVVGGPLLNVLTVGSLPRQSLFIVS
jgi:hypothetical protein